jgi:hypothetical protein
MKKLKIIIIFFFALSFSLHSQNKISVGVHLNSKISKTKLLESLAFLGESGEIGFGYSAGIQVQLTSKKNVFIRSGLNYQSINYRHIENQPGFAFNFPEDPLPFNENNFDITSIGIPLDIGYLIKSKKGNLNFPVGIGGEINFNLITKADSHKISPRFESGAQFLPGVDNEVDLSVFGLVFFGGVEFNLNNKLIIGFEPNLKLIRNRFIFDITDSIGKTAYEAGLNFRIRFLNKKTS